MENFFSDGTEKNFDDKQKNSKAKQNSSRDKKDRASTDVSRVNVDVKSDRGAASIRNHSPKGWICMRFCIHMTRVFSPLFFIFLVLLHNNFSAAILRHLCNIPPRIEMVHLGLQVLKSSQKYRNAYEYIGENVEERRTRDICVTANLSIFRTEYLVECNNICRVSQLCKLEEKLRHVIQHWNSAEVFPCF